MKEKLKKYYYETTIGYYLLRFPKLFYSFVTILKNNSLSDRKFIQKVYKKYLGREIDLKNPKLFTEKIQWLKLNDRRDLYTQCADKYLVRNYIESKIGSAYLIPLLFVSKRYKDIKIEDLPNIPFIIKTTHDSGGTFLVQDINKFNFKSIRREIKERLNKNFYLTNREWEYKNIRPRIIIEELLKDDSGNKQLNDYKIYCFHGEPKFIQTIFDREIETKEDWYDTDWNLLDVSYYSTNKKNIKKPKLLKELLKIAKILSEDFPYVRVDLYISNEQIYFGELTFRPYGGFMKFKPESFDLELGKYLDLKKIDNK